jgi:phytoene dehydrogenase-like protein
MRQRIRPRERESTNVRDMPSKVVVVGGGLGGLAAGILLAGHGSDVTLVEQGAAPGGYLQGFFRRGARFETALHYMGACLPGEPLARYLTLLGVYDDIRFLPTREASVVTLVLPGGRRISIPRGLDRFAENMKALFPEDARGIDEVMDEVEKCVDCMPWLGLRGAEGDVDAYSMYSAVSAASIFAGRITHPDLRAVFDSFCFDSTLVPDLCPFTLFTVVFYTMLTSSCRVQGGGSVVVSALVDRFESLGGKILLQASAESLVAEKRHTSAVVLADGTSLDCDLVISSCHPRETVRFAGRNHFSPSFLENLDSQEESVGAFKVYLELSRAPEAMKDDSWLILDDADSSGQGVFTLSPSNIDSTYGDRHTAEILVWQEFAEVAAWGDSRHPKRPQAYRDFKDKRADELIAIVERELPGLEASILHRYTSSTLTNRDYTRSHLGSAMGIRHDIHQQGQRRVRIRNRIRNLLLAGQSVGTPGIMGTIVHSTKLCNDIIPEADFLGDMMGQSF